MAGTKFLMPSTIVYGPGSVSSIGDLVAGMNAKKVLIVTDKVMVALGNVEIVSKALKEKNIDYEIFDEVATEPTIKFVENGLELFKKTGCEGLVAVGGGSPIDTAKAISVLSTNSGNIRDFKGMDKIPLPGVPIIAVPTTAGTGSEATRVSVITDEENDVKMMMGSNYMLPCAAIGDPLLTLGKPQGLTAATGIDALTHAIEAYVSVKQNPMSDIFALSAIGLISRNLRMAWSNGNNVDARAKMMLGALHGGIAFSNSSVALVHGMARPLGGVFNVPHGVSNAVLLKEVMEFSLLGNPERFAKIAETMGENIEDLSVMDAAYKAVKAVDQLVLDIKIPSLKDLGIEKDKLHSVAEKMAGDAIDSGSPGNNPRIATKQEIVDLYKRVYDAR